MRNYQCRKCGTLLVANSSPSNLGCPKGSSHHWTNLGETGDKNYQCKKCGTLIKARVSPTNLGCPQGASHQWIKL